MYDLQLSVMVPALTPIFSVPICTVQDYVPGRGSSLRHKDLAFQDIRETWTSFDIVTIDIIGL